MKNKHENTMLIDASHPEETRVVVVQGNRVDDFDYELASNKPLKGNIYLARVTRVEPSLQAAFIEYGGNRHGFLAFSEIHPDYYRIPAADREALLREEAEAARAAQVAEDEADDAEDSDDAAGDADADAQSADASSDDDESGGQRKRKGRRTVRRRGRSRGNGNANGQREDAGDRKS
ncbi:MAG: ribonuclease E/G, partial [Pseudomonadota bacterium]